MIKFTGNINNTLATSTQYDSQFTVAPYATTTYTVKAFDDESKFATCTVNVTEPVSGVSFTGADSIQKGSSQQYTANVIPIIADNKLVSWTSSNSYAAVTQVSTDTLTATVTGEDISNQITGTSQVTLRVASQDDPTKTYSKTITIHDYVASFVVTGYTNNGTTSINYGNTIQLQPVLTRESGSTQTIISNLPAYTYQITSGSQYMTVQQNTTTGGLYITNSNSTLNVQTAHITFTSKANNASGTKDTFILNITLNANTSPIISGVSISYSLNNGTAVPVTEDTNIEIDTTDSLKLYYTVSGYNLTTTAATWASGETDNPKTTGLYNTTPGVYNMYCVANQDGITKSYNLNITSVAPPISTTVTNITFENMDKEDGYIIYYNHSKNITIQLAPSTATNYSNLQVQSSSESVGVVINTLDSTTITGVLSSYANITSVETLTATCDGVTKTINVYLYPDYSTLTISPTTLYVNYQGSHPTLATSEVATAEASATGITPTSWYATGQYLSGLIHFVSQTTVSNTVTVSTFDYLSSANWQLINNISDVSTPVVINATDGNTLQIGNITLNVPSQLVASALTLSSSIDLVYGVTFGYTVNAYPTTALLSPLASQYGIQLLQNSVDCTGTYLLNGHTIVSIDNSGNSTVIYGKVVKNPVSDTTCQCSVQSVNVIGGGLDPQSASSVVIRHIGCFLKDGNDNISSYKFINGLNKTTNIDLTGTFTYYNSDMGPFVSFYVLDSNRVVSDDITLNSTDEGQGIYTLNVDYSSINNIANIDGKKQYYIVMQYYDSSITSEYSLTLCQSQISSLIATSFGLVVGGTKQMANGTDYTIIPTNVSGLTFTVNWTSSDVNKVTVDSSGMITAIATGTAVITAKTSNYGGTGDNDNWVTWTIIVKAAPVPVSSFTIAADSVYVGEEFKTSLRYAYQPNDATLTGVSTTIKYFDSTTNTEKSASDYIGSEQNYTGTSVINYWAKKLTDNSNDRIRFYASCVDKTGAITQASEFKQIQILDWTPSVSIQNLALTYLTTDTYGKYNYILISNDFFSKAKDHMQVSIQYTSNNHTYSFGQTPTQGTYCKVLWDSSSKLQLFVNPLGVAGTETVVLTITDTVTQTSKQIAFNVVVSAPQNPSTAFRLHLKQYDDAGILHDMSYTSTDGTTVNNEGVYIKYSTGNTYLKYSQYLKYEIEATDNKDKIFSIINVSTDNAVLATSTGVCTDINNVKISNCIKGYNQIALSDTVKSLTSSISITIENSAGTRYTLTSVPIHVCKYLAIGKLTFYTNNQGLLTGDNYMLYRQSKYFYDATMEQEHKRCVVFYFKCWDQGLDLNGSALERLCNADDIEIINTEIATSGGAQGLRLYTQYSDLSKTWIEGFDKYGGMYTAVAMVGNYNIGGLSNLQFTSRHSATIYNNCYVYGYLHRPEEGTDYSTSIMMNTHYDGYSKLGTYGDILPHVSEGYGLVVSIPNTQEKTSYIDATITKTIDGNVQPWTLPVMHLQHVDYGVTPDTFTEGQDYGSELNCTITGISKTDYMTMSNVLYENKQVYDVFGELDLLTDPLYPCYHMQIRSTSSVKDIIRYRFSSGQQNVYFGGSVNPVGSGNTYFKTGNDKDGYNSIQHMFSDLVTFDVNIVDPVSLATADYIKGSRTNERTVIQSINANAQSSKQTLYFAPSIWNGTTKANSGLTNYTFKIQVPTSVDDIDSDIDTITNWKNITSVFTSEGCTINMYNTGVVKLTIPANKQFLASQFITNADNSVAYMPFRLVINFTTGNISAISNAVITWNSVEYTPVKYNLNVGINNYYTTLTCPIASNIDTTNTLTLSANDNANIYITTLTTGTAVSGVTYTVVKNDSYLRNVQMISGNTINVVAGTTGNNAGSFTISAWKDSQLIVTRTVYVNIV